MTTPDQTMQVEAASGRPIEIKVREIGRLFHALDPLPFRERDLDSAVEEYVVGWARELPTTQPIEIVVHLPREEAERKEAGEIAGAIHNYFAYRSQATRNELRELFRVGRASVLIGVAVLAISVVVAGFAETLAGEGRLGRFLHESLLIFGWVANWRPIQIFLYDWWPLARRRALYDRLARAEVRLVSL
ncbi:MAG: hypothetical protein ACK4YQ_10595 [Phenylobacterium sp.]|uniref:hypothetical protein n=1 Tax=Phenylobacterium sp. TaxID=1871053 RepID=UPI00391CBD00